MKSKPRGKSSGLATVGKVLLGAALLAVDKVREKLNQDQENAKAKTKGAAAKKAPGKALKPATRKKPAAKRGPSKVGKPPKPAPAAKPSKGKKAS